MDGELAHERVVTNIVFGDVWYVAAPYGIFDAPAVKSAGVVRMMTAAPKGTAPTVRAATACRPPPHRKTSMLRPGRTRKDLRPPWVRRSRPRPASRWASSSCRARAGEGRSDAALKHWIAAEDLGRAPSLKADYEQLASMFPGTKPYEANVQRYLNEWKKYWSEYIPALMKTKAVPDGRVGHLPESGRPGQDRCVSGVQRDGRFLHTGQLKGIIFMSGKTMVEADEGAHFGEQLAALANSWKEKFACEIRSSSTRSPVHRSPQKSPSRKASRAGASPWKSTVGRTRKPPPTPSGPH